MKKSDWVIMPCYNEQANIAKVIAEVRRYCKNLVVVDDGSKDNTEEIAKKTNPFVLRHTINLGKGAALKTGCDYAFLHQADSVIALDADGQHKAQQQQGALVHAAGQDD